MKSGLFIGWYPNPIDKYKNVFFQNLVYEFARKGVQCTVISPVSYMKYRQKIFDIPKHYVDDIGNGITVDTYYPRTISASSIQIGKFNTEIISERTFEYTALRCAKKLEKHFDFAYGHFFLYGGLAAVLVGRVLEIPSFIAYGECDFASQVSNTYGIPRAEELQGLTGIVSVSSKNTTELNQLGFVKNVPIITAPNSTDLKMFYPKNKQECRKLLGLPVDKFIVGFVGGFIERKGDKRLLEAVEQLDDVYLAFAGCGDNPPQGDRVLFCKPLAHEDVSTLLNAVDVFALPTLSEGSCNAIVEAMACGVPIISSDLPFNDGVLDSDNSIRVNPNSVDEIKNAIKRLRDDLIERKRLADNALACSHEFEIGKRADKILTFISEPCYPG